VSNIKYITPLLLNSILVAIFCAANLSCSIKTPEPKPVQSPPAPTTPVQQPAPQPPQPEAQPTIPPKVAKVSYLAHSCFLITSSDGLKIITDPYNVIGYKPVNESADVVIISHEDWDHNNVAGVNGQPEVVRTPGIKSIKGIEFKTIEAWHDPGKTKPNNVISFTVDGIKFCFLGDLGSSLTNEQVSAIGGVDVLFIPVGGVYTINAQKATDTYNALKPGIVIPMHYRMPGLVFSLDGIDDFIQGKSNVRKLNSSLLEINKTELPAPTTIIVMDPAR